MRQVTESIGRTATALLGQLPMGASRVVMVEGREYLFRAEPHFGPPPRGWHKGITVYEAKS